MSTAATYLRLEVISGNAPGSTLVVEDELEIGRHASGAGRLSEDEEISRRHARISHEATGNYAIEDLGSSNGTFVNGLRIRSPRVLEEGDSIETGATTLVVKEIVRRGPPEAADGPVAPVSDARAAPTVFAPVPKIEEAAPREAAEEPVEESVEPAADARAAPTVFAPVPSLEEVAPAPAASPAPASSPAPSVAEPPAAVPAEEIPPPRLSLEIDFDAREARLALGDGGETVRLVFADGAWRVA
jgi:pSer/pThr/pTyr-binding forkhead associated (FHA) protein